MDRLRHIVMSALGYLVLARLALVLAIPPGYAVPVWPAAGLALFLAMRWGWPAAVGAALGSALANASVSFSVVPMAIGVGAGVQAYVGGLLCSSRGNLTRWNMGPLLALGVLSVSVNALYGPLVLALGGSVAPSGLWVQMATWWVGDAVGVLILLPLCAVPRVRVAVPTVLVAASGIALYVLLSQHMAAEPGALTPWLAAVSTLGVASLIQALSLSSVLTSEHYQRVASHAISRVREDERAELLRRLDG